MIKNVEFNDISKEVIIVMTCLDDNLFEKIPDKVLKKLLYYASKTDKEIYLDTNIKLKDQDISEYSKSLLAWIYYYYIAKDEEKAEIVKYWNKKI